MKTHCKNGHEYTPENTRIRSRGGRACRICYRIYRLKSESKLAFAGVYLITNLVTGKQYVGSAGNAKKRIVHHKACWSMGWAHNELMNSDLSLGHAFRIEVLEHTDSYREQEAWWIEFFNTMRPNGYNIRRVFGV
jgi:GIY-YIG catalytic domain